MPVDIQEFTVGQLDMIRRCTAEQIKEICARTTMTNALILLYDYRATGELSFENLRDLVAELNRHIDALPMFHKWSGDPADFAEYYPDLYALCKRNGGFAIIFCTSQNMNTGYYTITGALPLDEWKDRQNCAWALFGEESYEQMKSQKNIYFECPIEARAATVVIGHYDRIRHLILSDVKDGITR